MTKRAGTKSRAGSSVVLAALSLALLPLAGRAQQVPARKVVYYDAAYHPVATREEAASWVETIYQDSIRAVKLRYCAPGMLADSTVYANVRLGIKEGPNVGFHTETGGVRIRERYRADTLLSRITYHLNGRVRRRERYDRRGQRTLGKVFDPKGKELPFCEYQVLPTWPGGFAMFVQQVSGRVKYPLQALRNNEQGRVMIGFVVNKAGKVEDVHCLNPTEVPTLLVEEAEEQVRAMPALWQNGWLECEPVPVSFTVPVTFKIQ